MSLPWVAMAEQVLEPVPINFQPAEAIEDRLQCFFLVALLDVIAHGQLAKRGEPPSEDKIDNIYREHDLEWDNGNDHRAKPTIVC